MGNKQGTQTNHSEAHDAIHNKTNDTDPDIIRKAEIIHKDVSGLSPIDAFETRLPL